MQQLTIQPTSYNFKVKHKNWENFEELKNDKPIAFWEYIHENQSGFYVFQLLFYKEYPFLIKA